MKRCLQIRCKLLELDFHINSVTRIAFGQQIRLGCGAVINVYDKGTVMVQGKLLREDRGESLRLLKEILPVDTRWCIR